MLRNSRELFWFCVRLQILEVRLLSHEVFVLFWYSKSETVAKTSNHIYIKHWKLHPRHPSALLAIFFTTLVFVHTSIYFLLKMKICAASTAHNWTSEDLPVWWLRYPLVSQPLIELLSKHMMNFLQIPHLKVSPSQSSTNRWLPGGLKLENPTKVNQMSLCCLDVCMCPENAHLDLPIICVISTIYFNRGDQVIIELYVGSRIGYTATTRDLPLSGSYGNSDALRHRLRCGIEAKARNMQIYNFAFEYRSCDFGEVPFGSLLATATLFIDMTLRPSTVIPIPIDFDWRLGCVLLHERLIVDAYQNQCRPCYGDAGYHAPCEL